MRPYHEIMRELRESRDLTQADLALVLDIRQQAYSRYENGVTELPIHHLLTLCGFYYVSADYLLGLTDQK